MVQTGPTFLSCGELLNKSRAKNLTVETEALYLPTLNCTILNTHCKHSICSSECCCRLAPASLLESKITQFSHNINSSITIILIECIKLASIKEH